MGNQFYRLQKPKYLAATCIHRLEILNTDTFESVSRLLKEVIVSLIEICKSLLDAHVDPTTRKCSNYEQIRKHIEDAEKSMKMTETKINEKLEYLNKHMEELTREKLNLDQQKKEKCKDMDKLQIEITSAEKLLQDSIAALDQAEKNLESANKALTVAQERMKPNGSLWTWFVIPFGGWIVGSILKIEEAVRINKASTDFNNAEEHKQICDLKVKENIDKKCECNKNILYLQREIEKTNEALKRIEGELQGIQKDLYDTSNIQEKVRLAVTLLSVLGGRVTVLETHSKRDIKWDIIVKIMEDVMKAVVNIAESRLFCSDDLPALINTLRENVKRLRSLCNSPSNSEYDPLLIVSM